MELLGISKVNKSNRCVLPKKMISLLQLKPNDVIYFVKRKKKIYITRRQEENNIPVFVRTKYRIFLPIDLFPKPTGSNDSYVVFFRTKENEVIVDKLIINTE